MVGGRPAVDSRDVIPRGVQPTRLPGRPARRRRRTLCSLPRALARLTPRDDDDGRRK